MFIKIFSLSFLILIFLNFDSFTLGLKLGQQNVCSRPLSSLEEHRCDWRYSYSYEENSYCKTKVYLECCKGYKLLDNYDKCLIECPNCIPSNNSIAGFCNESNFCDCQLGFGGKTCNQTCPTTGHFGLDCTKNCTCITDPNCNKNYTWCDCDKSNLSSECADICKCRLHSCKIGFTGIDCKTKCQNNTYGNMCSNTCECVKNNTEVCDHVTGDCKCKPKYYGRFCENYCENDLKCFGFMNCTCDLTIEQKVEEIQRGKKIMETIIEDLKKDKTSLERYLTDLDGKHQLGSSHFLESIETIEKKVVDLASKLVNLTEQNKGHEKENEVRLGLLLDKLFKLEEKNDNLKNNYSENKILMEWEVAKVNYKANHLTFSLILACIWLIVLSAIIYRYKMKTKSLKSNLNEITLRNSNDVENSGFNNSIYMTNLAATKDTYETLNPPSSSGSSSAMNFFSKYLYKKDEKTGDKTYSVEKMPTDLNDLLA